MTRFARAEGSKGSNKKEYEEATSWKTMKADVESAKKQKKKKDKKKSSDKEVHLDYQASKSENKDKRTVIFDSEHSDGPVKKKCKSSSNVEDIDIVPESVLNQQNEEESTSKKKKKTKSLEELKKNWVIENGIKYKIFKNGIKKPWFDLAYEENDTMTRYNNFFVKREAIKELDDYKKSLEEQGLSSKEVTKKMFHKEEKLHNKLRVELLRNEIREKVPSEDRVSQKVKKPKGLNDTSNNSNQILNPKQNIKVKNPKRLSNSSNNFEQSLNSKQNTIYEENEIVTQFEGYWILRENLAHLQRVAEMKLNRIIQQRADGNPDNKLTSEEELLYRRLMKKEKRREHNLLKTRLSNRNIQNPRVYSNRRSENLQRRNEHQKDDELVKFDGYFIRKDGAERLNKLRETMMTKGCTEDEIENIIKNERRKEERILKRENKFFCFKCRSSGHMVSTCPESLNEGQDNSYDVCFRCGSAEHMARHCKVKSGGESYPLATCFICNEVGHISRECPDNPKGLYPNGGCCNQCGSVEHLKRDCPDLLKKNEENTIKLTRFCRGEEVERMEDGIMAHSRPISGDKPRNKIIIFDD